MNSHVVCRILGAVVRLPVHVAISIGRISGNQLRQCHFTTVYTICVYT